MERTIKIEPLSDCDDISVEKFNGFNDERNDVKCVPFSLRTPLEAPVQSPVKLPGMSNFMTTMVKPIQMQNIKKIKKLTPEDIAEMNKLAALTPEQLAAKIQMLQNEVYQLGVREAEEMTRGRSLGILNHKDWKK